MAKATIYDLDKKAIGELELDEVVFNGPVKEHLFWEMTKMQQAKRRAGSAATKDRSQVAASTAKMFRQKGTGRARKGARSAHGLVGGGTCFGPKPRDFSYSIPKKVRKAALRSALAARFKEGRLLIFNDFTLEDIKTKRLAGVMTTFELSNGLLVDGPNDNLRLSARNLANFKYLPTQGLNVYDVLRYDYLVLTKSAVDHVHGVLKP